MDGTFIRVIEGLKFALKLLIELKEDLERERHRAKIPRLKKKRNKKPKLSRRRAKETKVSKYTTKESNTL